MARPVSLERREELALKAFAVIRERGLYRITMSELAEALGMKRPSLYWYFRDLGHVFETVLEHTLVRQRAFLLARLEGLREATADTRDTRDSRVHEGCQGGAAPHSPPPHPIDLLYAYAEGMWDFFSAEGPYLLQLLSFWGHTEAGEPGRVIEVTQRYFQPLWQMAVFEVERGVREGRVASCEPMALVDLVSVVVDGALIHRVARGMPIEPMARLLWSSVLAPLRIPRRATPPGAGRPTPEPATRAGAMGGRGGAAEEVGDGSA